MARNAIFTTAIVLALCCCAAGVFLSLLNVLDVVLVVFHCSGGGKSTRTGATAVELSPLLSSLLLLRVVLSPSHPGVAQAQITAGACTALFNSVGGVAGATRCVHGCR